VNETTDRQEIKVLLVDGDGGQWEELVGYLRGECGFRVTIVNRLEEIQEIIKEKLNPCDVILIRDFVDPLSGECKEVSKLLQAIQFSPSKPEVIPFAAQINMGQALKWLRAGSYRYMVEPFNLNELGATIRVAAEVKQEKENSTSPYEVLKKIGAYSLDEVCDLDHAMDYIVNVAVETTQAEEGTLFVAGGKDGIRAWKNEGLSTRLNKESAQQILDKGFAGCVIKSGQSDLIPDIAEDNRWLRVPNNPQRGSAIGVPLVHWQQSMGVITLSHPNPNFFTRNHLVVLEIIAGHAVTMIVNVSTLETVRSLHRSGLAIASGVGFENTLAQVMQEALKAFGGFSSDIFLIDKKGMGNEEIVATHLLCLDKNHLDRKGERTVRSDGISRRVHDTGEIEIFTDTHDPEVFEEINPKMLEDGVRAAVCIPLHSKDRRLGVMWLHFQEPRQFSRVEIEALQIYANQAVIIYAGRINRRLRISCPNRNEDFFRHLVTQLELPVTCEQIQNRIKELEDLLRKLFYDFEALTLDWIEPGWRQESPIFLKAVAHREEGVTKTAIVRWGRLETVQKERDRHNKLIPSTGAPGFSHQETLAETLHYGATVYTFPHLDVERACSFAKFYREGTVEEVQSALDYLFQEVFVPWHARDQYQRRGLFSVWREWLKEQGEDSRDYNVCIEGIAQRSSSTAQNRLEISQGWLVFHLREDVLKYPDPVNLFFESDDFLIPCGPVYGRLNGSTILVDQDKQVALIDFAWSGPGPLVRDFVTLENAVKFDLLKWTELRERITLEQHLVQLKELGDISLGDCQLSSRPRKAFQVIKLIRRQAARVLGRKAFLLYQGALFCEALERLSRFHPERLHYSKKELLPYLHILASIACIGQILLPACTPKWSFWVDPKKPILFLSGQQVELTDSQWKILYYLYHHQGEPCSYEDIVEQGLGEQYSSQADHARIQSHISRIRAKLDSYIEANDYIETIQGEGYQLNLER
jgi:DNA-binding response OmpR family regulator/putative methionine-R-sulfoxide reductase with GAF domain